MDDVSNIIKLINDIKAASDSSRLCMMGGENQIEIFREIFGDGYDYKIIHELAGFPGCSDTVYVLPIEEWHPIRVVFEDVGEGKYG